MAYCVHKKYFRFEQELHAWQNACNSFINSGQDSWNYDFASNHEYTRSDSEQSVLSQLIFLTLYNHRKHPRQCGGQMADGISISIGENQFLFDVMHNPNRCQPRSQAAFLQKELSFGNIYHTIGNFAPVPRTIVSHNYGPNLQLIHRALNEIWPWTLKFLRDNWCSFPTHVEKTMSFCEYIQWSCQQMYFQPIFDSVYPHNQNNFTSADWNTRFVKLDDAKITPETPLFSFDALYEQNKIEEIDRQIRFLIELRGRYILHLCQQSNHRTDT